MMQFLEHVERENKELQTLRKLYYIIYVIKQYEKQTWKRLTNKKTCVI
jgi:hypothetical protein